MKSPKAIMVITCISWFMKQTLKITTTSSKKQ
jgi:hypothetical protein